MSEPSARAAAGSTQARSSNTDAALLQAGKLARVAGETSRGPFFFFFFTMAARCNFAGIGIQTEGRLFPGTCWMKVSTIRDSLRLQGCELEGKTKVESWKGREIMGLNLHSLRHAQPVPGGGTTRFVLVWVCCSRIVPPPPPSAMESNSKAS